MTAFIRILSIFSVLLIVTFDSFLIFLQAITKEFNLDSFFLGLISVLLGIVGYMTKRASERNEESLEKLKSKLNILDKRLVAIETRLKIENGIDDLDLP